MNLRLLRDLVLVVLPPLDDQANAAGLFEAHAMTQIPTHGRVVRCGPRVRDVAVGDVVAFPPEAGDPITVGVHPCLLLSEAQIEVIVPKREGV